MIKTISALLLIAVAALADPGAGNLQVVSPSVNPLTNGLKFIAYPTTTNSKNIVNGDPITLAGGAALTTGAGPGGVGSALVSNGGNATYPLPSQITGTLSHNWTIWIHSNITTLGGDWSGLFAIPTNPATSCANGTSINMMKYSSGTNAAANECGTLDGTQHYPNFDPASNGGYWSSSAGYVNYALVFNGTTVTWYKDGVAFETIPFNRPDNALFWDSTQAIQLFAGMGGSIDAVGIWSKALTSTDLTSLKDSPYQLVANYYNLSGTLGSAAAGAKVTISGPVSATLTADTSGNYFLDHVLDGSYTVTVRKIGVSFSPGTSQSVTVSGANATLNFTSSVIPSGNVKLELQSQSPTSAGITIRGYGNNPCVLNLFAGTQITAESHPDATDSVDTSRSDTQIFPESRLARVGHDTGNNAMAGGKPYLLNVVCGTAGQANLLFTQPFQTSVATENPAPGWDPSKPNNYDFPDIDWTSNTKKFVLPFTGVEGNLTLAPFNRRWETISGLQGIHFTSLYEASSGWTNPINVISTGDPPSAYGASGAGNQNPVYLVESENPNERHNVNQFIIDHKGIQVWGSGDASADADRQVDFCITTNVASGTCDANPDASFTVPYFSVVLPPSANGAAPNSDTLAAMSHASNPPWPVGFPAPRYKGWNTFVEQRRHAVKDIVINDITAGVVTLGGGGIGFFNPFFPEGLKGNILHIPGVAAASCPNDNCIVSDVPSPDKAILADTSITRGSFSGVTAHQFAIRAWKHTATGSIQLATKFINAGRIGQGLGTAGPGTCSKVKYPINGKSGNNCFITWKNFNRATYWMPDDPDGTPMWISSLSWSPSNNANWPNIPNFNDRPAPSDGLDDQGMENGGASWDPVDPNKLYVFQTTKGGGIGLFKGELWKNPVSTPTDQPGTYYDNQGSSNAPSWPEGNILWTNLTPSGSDLVTQLKAKYPSYLQYSAIGYDSHWSLKGMAGSLAIFAAWLGQDSSPCLIAVMDTRTSPATLGHYFSSMSDSDNLAEANGGFAESRWGACHAVGVVNGFPNTVVISVNVAGDGTHGGDGIIGRPQIMVPDQIMMQDGSWSGVAGSCPGNFGDAVSANCKTRLQWPPPAAGGSSSTLYKSDYPGDISALPPQVQGLKYANNQFVRIRFKGPGAGGAASGKNWVCTYNNAATSSWPTCGWNSGYKASYSNWKPIPGDKFSFGIAGGFCGLGNNNTCENMMVAAINEVTDSYVDMWVLRDATYQWSCPSKDGQQIDGSTGGPGKHPTGLSACGGVANDGSADQLQPGNGWFASFIPGWNAMKEIIFKVQFNDDGSLAHFVEQDAALSGHSGEGIGRSGDAGLFGYSSAYPNVSASLLEQYNLRFYDGNIPSYTLTGRNANGLGAFYGQSYLNGNGYRPDSVYRGVAIDDNRIAGTTGGMDMFVSTVTKVAGKTNVYKTTVNNPEWYKIAPLYVFAGNRVYGDMSGPTCNIDAMPNYTFCFIYRAGVTAGVAGEAVGDLYAKSPYLFTGTTTAYASVDYAVLTPIWLGHGEGGLRQWIWEENDPHKLWSRFLGYLAPPGFAQGFSESGVTTFGNKLMTAPGGPISGYGSASITLHLPPQGNFIRDFSKYNYTKYGTYTAYQVKLPAYPGAVSARMKFGFDPSFHCRGGKDVCVTDESASPFAFLSEAASPTSCASGCTIPVPVVPSRLYWAKPEYLNGSGTVIGTGRIFTISAN
jgi:hypothetical protein